MSELNEYDNKSYKICRGSGFRTDMERLFSKFLDYHSTKYIVFAQSFRQLNFSLIFRGRQNENEMHEFIEECYLEVLSQLLNKDRTMSERMAALFLLYSLYLKQPLDQSYKHRFDFQIRITFDQLLIIREFINQCKFNSYYDCFYIWYKLLSLKAIDFVYYRYQTVGPSNTRSSHYLMSHNSTSTIDTLLNHFHKSVHYRLDQLQVNHNKYVEYKDSVFHVDSDLSKSKPNIIGHDLFKDSVAGLTKLANDFRLNRPNFKARGRPSVWTALATDANHEIATTHSGQTKLIAANKTIKSKKNVKKESPTSVVLWTEEIKDKIKKEKERIYKRKSQKKSKKKVISD